MELIEVRRALLQPKFKTYGGLPVYIDNACFRYRNGLVTDYVTDSNFFITGPFDSGSTGSKVYTISRYPETASGGVTPAFRPYDDLTATSIDYWAIGSSNNPTRSVTTAGRYLLVPMPKAKAANMYMQVKVGDVYVYIFKGKNVT